MAKILSYNIYPIVFFVTIIIGYLIVVNDEYRNGGRYAREYPREERHPKEYVDNRDMKYKIENKKIEDKNTRPYKSEFSWGEVGDEFKKASLNVGKAINNAFDGKKKEDNKNVAKKKSTKKKIKKKRK